jgi:hypothetical protein
MYHELRHQFTGDTVSGWSDITDDPGVAAALSGLYGADGWDLVDAWVGLLAEPHAPGASVGPTLSAIVVDQFIRLRDGDAFFFEWDTELDAVRDEIRNTTLRDIILANTNIRPRMLQEGVFFAPEPGGCVRPPDRLGGCEAQAP